MSKLSVGKLPLSSANHCLPIESFSPPAGDGLMLSEIKGTCVVAGQHRPHFALEPATADFEQRRVLVEPTAVFEAPGRFTLTPARPAWYAGNGPQDASDRVNVAAGPASRQSVDGNFARSLAPALPKTPDATVLTERVKLYHLEQVNLDMIADSAVRLDEL